MILEIDDLIKIIYLQDIMYLNVIQKDGNFGL